MLKFCRRKPKKWRQQSTGGEERKAGKQWKFASLQWITNFKRKKADEKKIYKRKVGERKERCYQPVQGDWWVFIGPALSIYICKAAISQVLLGWCIAASLLLVIKEEGESSCEKSVRRRWQFSLYTSVSPSKANHVRSSTRSRGNAFTC